MSLYDYIWKIMLRKIPYEKEGTRYTAGHRHLPQQHKLTVKTRIIPVLEEYTRKNGYLCQLQLTTKIYERCRI